jgi:hypothetical protein
MGERFCALGVLRFDGSGDRPMFLDNLCHMLLYTITAGRIKGTRKTYHAHALIE